MTAAVLDDNIGLKAAVAEYADTIGGGVSVAKLVDGRYGAWEDSAFARRQMFDPRQWSFWLNSEK